MSQKKLKCSSPRPASIQVNIDSDIGNFAKRLPKNPKPGFEIPRHHRNDVTSETETYVDSP
jgi:hypothetical protein